MSTSDAAGDRGRRVPAAAQGLLFTDDLPVLPEGAGYRGTTACGAAGITYRQLDYWARTDLVRPSVADATGSGSRRRYSYRDLLELKVVKTLLDAGIKLESVRDAFKYLRDQLGEDIASAQLIISGGSATLVRDDDELGVVAAALLADRLDRDVVDRERQVEADEFRSRVAAEAAVHKMRNDRIGLPGVQRTLDESGERILIDVPAFGGGGRVARSEIPANKSLDLQLLWV